MPSPTSPPPTEVAAMTDRSCGQELYELLAGHNLILHDDALPRWDALPGEVRDSYDGCARDLLQTLAGDDEPVQRKCRHCHLPITPQAAVHVAVTGWADGVGKTTCPAGAGLHEPAEPALPAGWAYVGAADDAG